jgi:hypothetical protein
MRIRVSALSVVAFSAFPIFVSTLSGNPAESVGNLSAGSFRYASSVVSGGSGWQSEGRGLPAEDSGWQ